MHRVDFIVLSRKGKAREEQIHRRNRNSTPHYHSPKTQVLIAKVCHGSALLGKSAMVAVRQLQNNSLIADSPRDALTVQIFQQGDGILARYASQILEAGYIHFWGIFFLLNDISSQSLQRIAM